MALECAGFLKGLGFDVSIMVRSIYLRGFDQQCADFIGNYLGKEMNCNIIRPAVPKSITKVHYLRLMPRTPKFDFKFFLTKSSIFGQRFNFDTYFTTANFRWKIAYYL